MYERVMAGKITRIKSNKQNVLAFSLEGKLNANQVRAMADVMNEMFDCYGEIRLLLFINAHEGQDLSAMLDPKLLLVKIKEFASLEKFAVVGASDISDITIETFSGILSMDAETFEASQKEKAWEFIGASPVQREILC